MTRTALGGSPATSSSRRGKPRSALPGLLVVDEDMRLDVARQARDLVRQGGGEDLRPPPHLERGAVREMLPGQRSEIGLGDVERRAFGRHRGNPAVGPRGDGREEDGPPRPAALRDERELLERNAEPVSY